MTRDARQRRAGFVENAAAQDSDPLLFDRARGDPLLDRVAALVEEGGRIVHRGGDRLVERGAKPAGGSGGVVGGVTTGAVGAAAPGTSSPSSSSSWPRSALGTGLFLLLLLRGLGRAAALLLGRAGGDDRRAGQQRTGDDACNYRARCGVGEGPLHPCERTAAHLSRTYRACRRRAQTVSPARIRACSAEVRSEGSTPSSRPGPAGTPGTGAGLGRCGRRAHRRRSAPGARPR